MFGKWEEGGREEGSGGQIKVENLDGDKGKGKERREGQERAGGWKGRGGEEKRIHQAEGLST